MTVSAMNGMRYNSTRECSNAGHGAACQLAALIPGSNGVGRSGVLSKSLFLCCDEPVCSHDRATSCVIVF